MSAAHIYQGGATLRTKAKSSGMHRYRGSVRWDALLSVDVGHTREAAPRVHRATSHATKFHGPGMRLRSVWVMSTEQ
eukprot:scaffold42443_cov33-Tisochrysis_lutea.AAC.4